MFQRFSRSCCFRKKFKYVNFKELAQSHLVDIVTETIERIALMGIEKILSETLFKKEKR